MTKKLCIFDLDGTLIDSLYDLADAMNYALEKNGITGVTGLNFTDLSNVVVEIDYNIDVKKALQEHSEYEHMICHVDDRFVL